jgi:predicted nucleic acid-binding protein
MNVVDSSGWLEYFADGPNANFFAPAIEEVDQLLVSTINLYEVAKRIEQQYDNLTAVDFLQAMRIGKIISVDETIALHAADLSLQHKLPMADSMILATAHIYGATLWTQDAHFATIAGVQYVAKS